MLKKNYLAECINSMRETVIYSLCAFSETQSIKELHHLRVELKRIFALTALLQSSICGFDFFKHLRTIKTISLKTGEIRNIQLALRTIKYYLGKDSLLYKEQHANLKKLTNAFCLKIPLFVKNLKEAQKSVFSQTSDIEDSSVLDWYKAELKKLEMFSTEKSLKSMHEGRKILKKLLYVCAILQNPLQEKVKLNKHYLRKFEEAIGKWHDTVVTIRLLAHSDFSNKEIKGKLLEKKQRLQKSCHTLSKHFSEKAIAG